uniref:Uncharacterized protein n=1 Tax=Ditylenchus dipsaci TaxID=166011 RepID=A0A915E1E6_9BILA
MLFQQALTAKSASLFVPYDDSFFLVAIVFSVFMTGKWTARFRLPLMPSYMHATPSSTCNNSSSSTSSKSFNSCSTPTAVVLPRSSSSATRKGVYVAICICVVEIAYKLALIPLLMSDTTLVLCLLLLCLFPLGVVVGLGLNLPLLCLPYLLYNFLWILVYGVSAVFFLYELVVMNKDYQHLVESLLNTFYSNHPTNATIRNIESVVYILTLVVLFVSIFGSLFALNIQNVVHQAYFHKKASIRAAKHIKAAVALAEQRQLQQQAGHTPTYYYPYTTGGTISSTISSPRMELMTDRVASPATWTTNTSPVFQYPNLHNNIAGCRMEEPRSPTVSLV